MSNAQVMFIVAKIIRLAAMASTEMAEGMWNPYFCACDATDRAIGLREDFQRLINQLAPRKD